MFKCCGKMFASHRGLRIHQGKKCKRKTTAQQRRSEDCKTTGRIPQEANHSGNDPALEQTKKTIGERKPMIRWSKANEAALYKQFDEEVNRKLIKMKGTTDQKLEKLAGTIYEEGLKRFGLEVEKKAKNRALPRRQSRRQNKIEEVKKEKKRLRTQWLRAEEDEKAGLKELYEEVKKKHRQLLRDERRANRRKKERRSEKISSKTHINVQRSSLTKRKVES